MYAGGIEHTDRLEGESHSSTNERFEKDKLCLLPVKQYNQSDTVTCSQLKLNTIRHAQNNLIILMLKIFEERVSKLLEQCREERRVVQEHILICKKGDTYCRKPFDCSYCPDFKISRLFASISNADTLMKQENQELRVMDMVYTRIWSKFHRSKLEEAIVAIETENKIKEENQKIETLQKTLEETEDTERKVEIERKLRDCESNAIFKMTPKYLCANLETEYDWVSISYNVFRGQFTPEECSAMWHSYLHPNINKTSWTVKEKQQLKELATKYRVQDWDSIAMELGTGRSALQCIVYYFNDKQTFFEGRWSKRENKVLKNAVKQLAVGSSIPWHIVANYLPGRNKRQVWEHWNYTLNPLIKKGAFTEEEDMLLIAAVRKHGKKFDKVAEVFKDRTSAQLRHRYTLVLEQPKQFIKWSPQDDALLLQLAKQYGEGEWKKISEHFLHFNRTQVRQHYKVLKKRQPTTSEEEHLTDEEQDCIDEKNLIATTSSLVYGTSSNVDKAKRSKLEKMLLPIRIHTREPVIPFSVDFRAECFSHFRFMRSNPYPKEMKTQYEDEQIERKFHWLSCVLYILQAKLLIPGYNNPLLSHHLLSDTDSRIISLLRDRYLVTEKETTNGLLACKTEPVNEELAEDYQHISVLCEADSANSSLVKFTMPLNHTTLTGFQSLSSHCEFLKEKIDADVVKHEGNAYSLFEKRLFCLFFWPMLASDIEPKFTGSKSDAEQPKVRKRIHPSRIKKIRRPWLRREKDVDAPQRMKRKYVKSGKYKKEQTTEVSEIRRSSRIASTSVSWDCISIMENLE